ncbi:MAG: efflux RND transporter periplasmic adaptor subunit [Candidatus Rokuibacteriota bacterium]
MRRSRVARALRRVGIAAVLLAVAGLTGLYMLRPPAVTVAAVTTRDIAAAIQGIGTVEAKTLVSVSSKITGRLVAVLVDEGDTITAGQLVARLDDAQYRADMDRAEATVRATDAQLRDLLAGARTEEIEQLRARVSIASATRTLMEQDFQRVQNLFARELISTQDRDRARQAYDVGTAQEREARHALELALQGTRKDLIEAGRAQLQAAQASLVLAKEKLADTRIDSPLTGYVVSRALEAGSIVNPGAAIYKLADPTTAWATVSVDARDTAGVAVGDAADITFRSVPGRVFRGRVARIQREGDRVTEQLAVDVAFAEHPARLTLGEQVEIAIRPPVRRGATALPLAALVRRPDGAGALVVADGRLHFRAARLGIVDPAGWAEVLEGLRPGDEVVLVPGLLAEASNEGRRVSVTRAPVGP